MVKVAWIQGKSQGSIEANIHYYKGKIDELMADNSQENKPELVLLPELFLTDYFAIEENPDYFNLAFLKDSDEVKAFKDLAKTICYFFSFSFL